MGIDALDLVFRLEREFDFKLVRGEANKLYGLDPSRPRLGEITAGDVHENLCSLLRAQNKSVPENSWERVQKCMAECLFIKPQEVHPNSRLIEDLGLS